MPERKTFAKFNAKKNQKVLLRDWECLQFCINMSYSALKYHCCTNFTYYFYKIEIYSFRYKCLTLENT